MLQVLVVYVHLLATCVALGSILASDLRLVTRLRDVDFRLAPPAPFVAGLIAGSLVVLVVTGAVLVALGMQQRPDYLANPKLHAKLALVVALVANAVVLHRSTFPWLARGKRLRVLSTRVAFGVALPVAVSMALWLYVAFLGVARPWNFVMPASQVMAFGAALVASGWGLAMVVVQVAALQQRARRAALRVTRPASLPASDGPLAFGATDAKRVAAQVLQKARRSVRVARAAAAVSVDSLLETRPWEATVEALAEPGSR